MFCLIPLPYKPAVSYVRPDLFNTPVEERRIGSATFSLNLVAGIPIQSVRACLQMCMDANTIAYRTAACGKAQLTPVSDLQAYCYL